MKSSEGRWGGGADEVVVVVGRCVCKREAGGGLGSKTTKTSVAARFRVRRAKRGCRTMGRGGGAVRISLWWWWGCAFASARRGNRLGGKNHETERNGSISAVPCKLVIEGDGGRW